MADANKTYTMQRTYRVYVTLATGATLEEYTSQVQGRDLPTCKAAREIAAYFARKGCSAVVETMERMTLQNGDVFFGKGKTFYYPAAPQE